MRLAIQIELSNPVIPKDYRRGFMSFIKACFQKEDFLFFEKLYNQKTDKAFTFSIYFPGLKNENSNGHLNVGNKAVLNFSSNDFEVITNLYNGVRKLKSHKWNSHLFSIIKHSALFNKKIQGDICLFKTVSPFLVNKEGENLRYLTPNDEEFDRSFRYSVQALCNSFLQTNAVEFDYRFLRHKKMVVSHYNQSMTCNKGVIEMKANPEVLDLLYNVGIGVRRSQGFGMLELAK